MVHDGNGGGFFDQISAFIGKRKQIQCKVVVPCDKCKVAPKPNDMLRIEVSHAEIAMLIGAHPDHISTKESLRSWIKSSNTRCGRNFREVQLSRFIFERGILY